MLAMLAQLVRSTSTCHAPGDRERAVARLARARAFIDTHFTRAFQPELAAVAGFHRGQFAPGVQAALGVTPWQYQRRRQIEWVKAELIRGDRSIAAIAHDAGFADHSHLTRAFHAAEGTPPSAVRRSVPND